MLRYSFGHWKLISVAIAAMVVSAATEPAFAALMRPLLDGSFVDRDPQALTWVPVMMLVIFGLRGIANYFSTYYMERVGRQVINQIRNEIFTRYLQLPTKVFDQSSSGELISRITYNTEQVANAATTSITILVRDTLTVIGLLGWMFYLSWSLALSIFVVVPVVAWIIMYVTKKFRSISRRIQSSMGSVSHVVEEIVEGHRVVKVFGGQQYEIQRFSEVTSHNTELNIELARVKAATTPMVQFLVALVLAGIVVFATRESFRDVITVGTFMSFMTAMMMLLTPIRRLTNVNAIIQKGVAAGESIFALLDSAPEPDLGTEPLPHKVRGEIEYRDVSFRYGESDEAVLKNINLRIEPGQTVAFVGRSGSGKTTLVNLLPRLYDISEGEIKLDGIRIADLVLADLRSQFAYVGQNVTLFSGSIRNNIAYGSLEQASDESIEAAARAAHAWEFIERLPRGLDAEVGENGVMLSGGQRQRLAIARALLKNAPILILDEATASLDTEAERHIQAALEAVSKGRTTLVIAHRLSTVERADRIVVMQAGEIAEAGTHVELLAQRGIYASLYQMQFSDA